MKELVILLEKNKYQAVSSYIQTGNIVLKSLRNPLKIKEIVYEHYGFSPEIFILNEPEFLTALANNPFAQYEGKFVHFYFCHKRIELNVEKLNHFMAPSEEYFVKGSLFYLYAPNGIGRSKLVSNIEACLGQSGTGRNLNTVNKISLMLKTPKSL